MYVHSIVRWSGPVIYSSTIWLTSLLMFDQSIFRMSSNRVDDSSRFIEIHKYVEERAVQVADLLHTVDNSKLVSGEVTKGPRTAAQRLPRHMRRRAMAYEVRRFPKGLRLFASPFIISKHRDKPPSRYFRRRSRNLLMNYIRRQRRAVWLETHIWHAKRFHMVDRWGYRLPDRSFQRNFRPLYRASLRHCAIRDKSYLSCIVITHSSQDELIDLLRPFCQPSTSPTFAFRSCLNGRYEMTSMLYMPGEYPQGLIGPVRFLWSRCGSDAVLSLWVHPACRQRLLDELTKLFGLEKLKAETSEECSENVDSEPAKDSLEQWRLERMNINTDIYTSKDGIVQVQDLRDQMTRLRLYGPLSMPIIADCLKCVTTEEGHPFQENHDEWSTQFSKLRSGEIADGTVFSLLVEDPRISRPTKRRLPVSKEEDMDIDSGICEHLPRGEIWDRQYRISALEKRITDSELNKLKGVSVATIESTPCKIPVLVVVRNGGSGKADALSGLELITPCGFGADFWLACQLRCARASGRRDDLAAHLEARKLEFPTDVCDSSAGVAEQCRIRNELEEQYAKRPHNRRVIYWKTMSIKFPFSFEFDTLMKEWSSALKLAPTSTPYVLRDRRLILGISDWMRGKSSKPEDVLTAHASALVPIELECVARGRPKQFALVCLPTKEDLEKVRTRHKNGPVVIVQRPRDYVEEPTSTKVDSDPEGTSKHEEKMKWQSDMWKDVVSTDLSTREKPISLKPLFPDTKIVDKAAKRRIANRTKKDNAKRRRLERPERLRVLNEEAAEIAATPYREAASRLTVGRVVRGDYSFSAARGRALAYVPLCVLPLIKSMGNTLLLRNISSKYYHPANVSILKETIDI